MKRAVATVAVVAGSLFVVANIYWFTWQLQATRGKANHLATTASTFRFSLTNSSATVLCVQPLVPVYDRVLLDDLPHNTRKIPRTIHISMKSRCLPKDLAYGVQKWKDALPDHSLYFHDDNAVDRLFHSGWPEFPDLLTVMKCVRKGAMKIDVWRLLVLYRYGGIYTDIDNWPGPRINDWIRKTDTAFFVSDAYQRPSQWFMAMEPRHPIAYYSMLEVLQRVLDLPNVNQPKVVITTGPDAVKHGFGRALLWQWNAHVSDHVETFRAVGNRIVRKISFDKYSQVVDTPQSFFKELVAWNSTENITRKERIYREAEMMHWQKEIYKSSKSKRTRVSCRELLVAEMQRANNGSTIQ